MAEVEESRLNKNKSTLVQARVLTHLHKKNSQKMHPCRAPRLKMETDETSELFGGAILQENVDTKTIVE